MKTKNKNTKTNKQITTAPSLTEKLKKSERKKILLFESFIAGVMAQLPPPACTKKKRYPTILERVPKIKTDSPKMPRVELPGKMPRNWKGSPVLFWPVLILLLFCASCASTPHSPGAPGKAGPAAITLHGQISAAQKSLQDVQEPLTQSGTHIDNAKVAVLTSDTSTAGNELDAAKAKLLEGKDLVTQASVAMLSALGSATQTVAAAQLSDKAISDLTAERDVLKSRLQSQSAWVFKVLLTIAAGLIVAGIGIGVASAMMGFASVRVGALVAIGGVILLVLTLTLQHYEKQIIIGCGLLLLSVFAYFCWKLFVSIKANKELVQFGEALKTKATPELLTQLFGSDDDAHPNSIADSIQSDSTQKIVKQLREHLQMAIEKKGM